MTTQLLGQPLDKCITAQHINSLYHNLFFGLLNDTVNRSDYTASNDRMTED
jgi:hypothetical protein